MGWLPGIEALSWALLRYAHNKADLTLCTSPQVQQQMKENGVERVEVWRKGIDVEVRRYGGGASVAFRLLSASF